MRRSIISDIVAAILVETVPVQVRAMAKWEDFAVFAACRLDDGVVGIVEN